MKQNFLGKEDHSLEIKGLDKLLGKGAAISQLNLNLSSGKKIALLGLNGAGKSSFIRLLVGESMPDSGQIVFKTNKQNGSCSLSPQDLRFKRSLGYQSDTMLAISEMSGREYLSLCGSLKGLNRQFIKEQIDLLSFQWAIADLLEQPMTALSKGNLQKLAIAQAFIGEPEWLFFDEPCQSLDPLEQDRFNQNIKSLADIQLCIFSTHNVSHALEVADEVILFHQAKIIYHFNIRAATEEDNEVYQHKYFILVCKKPNNNLSQFAENLDLSIKDIGRQIYQIKAKSTQSIEQLKENLQQAKVELEFCLVEAQAVMPLFRLLASGEVDFQLPDSANSSQVDGADL